MKRLCKSIRCLIRRSRSGKAAANVATIKASIALATPKPIKL